ncbi:MAG: 4Fe-4S binding protein [Proteobacteria bacterium]|nr:4Fe-4S binding protein [Pseudomonadota bacterium]MBU1582023.1 4Fe-4S binding protein [Pseudomonadota bacterium]MBU2632044.1 4Fe-4S binding protein [Pseudomonadota bacterium]
MNDTTYHTLAKVLDHLPNGFPATGKGLEIKILKELFTEPEADLCCDLRLTFETANQIADRTLRSKAVLEDTLIQMWKNGLIFSIDLGGIKKFKILPWMWGIYEFQINRINEKTAALFNEYFHYFGPQFFSNKPQYPMTIPVEKTIPVNHEALPYETVSSLIEAGVDFAVNACMCRKEAALLGNPCDKPSEVCLGIAPLPDFFKTSLIWGRRISKNEAYQVLKASEEAGLVHVTSNIQRGHSYICNCCNCCCNMLKSINMFGIQHAFNSNFYAKIDSATCCSCGICSSERCQVNAIKVAEASNQIIAERCIGCGLCVTTCPTGAATLVRKDIHDIIPPPKYESKWFKERGNFRQSNVNTK